MIKTKKFGKTEQGKEVVLFSFKNSNNIEVGVLNYGGIIHSIKTPDRHGNIDEITIGFDTFEQYLNNSQYFGAIIGRYANRIKNSQFVLDNKEYLLYGNQGDHHLHGGKNGFDKKIWHSEIENEKGLEYLKLSYKSHDNEEGYPGNLDTQVVYSLTDKNELVIKYTAKTDMRTPVNLTSHAYFNLTGDSKKPILDHELTINADNITEVDRDCIPTGNLLNVEGTPFDFRKQYPIGKRINSKDDQLLFGKGYDHNYVLNSDCSIDIPAAIVYDPFSSRRMELFATQPGIQFYSGNNLDENQIGKNGIPIQFRHGFCLETQHFPDSPNNVHFPSTILEPGKSYNHRLVMKFSA